MNCLLDLLAYFYLMSLLCLFGILVCSIIIGEYDN
jgi:hypothetical protein